MWKKSLLAIEKKVNLTGRKQTVWKKPSPPILSAFLFRNIRYPCLLHQNCHYYDNACNSKNDVIFGNTTKSKQKYRVSLCNFSLDDVDVHTFLVHEETKKLNACVKKKFWTAGMFCGGVVSKEKMLLKKLVFRCNLNMQKFVLFGVVPTSWLYIACMCSVFPNCL